LIHCIGFTLFLICSGCATIRVNNLADRLAPSNDRNWTRDMKLVTTAQISADTVTVRNIRNCTYVTERDYTVDYYDRTIPLAEIRSVDFIVVPFNNMPAIAHTMLSFELADGSYLSVSVEIRKELGEEYTPMLGISNQFELIYVVADERDLIRLRTRYRNAEVYVYPTVATPEQSQQLFVDICQRINQLAARPEFYHTFGNNCTTNIVEHVNELSENRVPFTWKVLLPGYSAQYAYDLGMLDNRLDFEELQTIALVNDLADEYFDEPDFSQRIRARRGLIDSVVAKNQRRREQQNASSQAALTARGTRGAGEARTANAARAASTSRTASALPRASHPSHQTQRTIR
jgi:hypothetical protein